MSSMRARRSDPDFLEGNAQARQQWGGQFAGREDAFHLIETPSDAAVNVHGARSRAHAPEFLDPVTVVGIQLFGPLGAVVEIRLDLDHQIGRPLDIEFR